MTLIKCIYIYIYILDEKNTNIVSLFMTKAKLFLIRAEYLKTCIKDCSQPCSYSSNTNNQNNV